jgi:hypothetical protein
MYLITHQSRAVLLHIKRASDMICHDRYSAQVSDKGSALYAPHLSACEQLVRVKIIVGCNAMHCCDIGALVPGYTAYFPEGSGICCHCLESLKTCMLNTVKSLFQPLMEICSIFIFSSFFNKAG